MLLWSCDTYTYINTCHFETNTTVAFSNPTSPEIIWGLGGPEEDHQLHHCCWTGRVSEREEEKKKTIWNPQLKEHSLWYNHLNIVYYRMKEHVKTLLTHKRPCNAS